MTGTRTYGKYKKAGHPLYDIWLGMIHRCNGIHEGDWYTERGITVCERWQNFDTFVDDILATIGPRPDRMSLDRTDNGDNYEPGKVRWATQTEQIRNRRALRRKGRSIYRGVYLRPDNKTKPWQAYGNLNYRRIFLGNFVEEEDAARARDRWTLETFGSQYDGFNFPEEVGR